MLEILCIAVALFIIGCMCYLYYYYYLSENKLSSLKLKYDTEVDRNATQVSQIQQLQNNLESKHLLNNKSLQADVKKLVAIKGVLNKKYGNYERLCDKRIETITGETVQYISDKTNYIKSETDRFKLLFTGITTTINVNYAAFCLNKDKSVEQENNINLLRLLVKINSISALLLSRIQTSGIDNTYYKPIDANNPGLFRLAFNRMISGSGITFTNPPDHSYGNWINLPIGYIYYLVAIISPQSLNKSYRCDYQWVPRSGSAKFARIAGEAFATTVTGGQAIYIGVGSYSYAIYDLRLDFQTDQEVCVMASTNTKEQLIVSPDRSSVYIYAL